MKHIAIVIISLVLSGCDLSGFFSKEVGSAIRKEVRDNGAKEIDLAEIVPFMWDELYLFEPYTPTSDICKILRITGDECSSIITQESMDDGEMYMVFKSDGNIVHTEMYIRFNGDFIPIYPRPIKREKSTFMVVDDGDMSFGAEPWLKLVPVSSFIM